MASAYVPLRGGAIRRPVQMRVAVIINGPHGSGQSTLAPALAAARDLPLPSKDAVKVTLLDQLGFTDRAQSRSIGAASGEVLWTRTRLLPTSADAKQDARRLVPWGHCYWPEAAGTPDRVMPQALRAAWIFGSENAPPPGPAPAGGLKPPEGPPEGNPVGAPEGNPVGLRRGIRWALRRGIRWAARRRPPSGRR